MFGFLEASRTSLILLFKLRDRLVEVKQLVDDILDRSKAVIAPVGHPDVGPNPGWGEDNVPAMFKPLLISPEVTLAQEDEELCLSDIDRSHCPNLGKSQRQSHSE